MCHVSSTLSDRQPAKDVGCRDDVGCLDVYLDVRDVTRQRLDASVALHVINQA